MPDDSGVLVDIAGAIMDDSPVDWASAESSAGAEGRSVLQQLRVVAAVADLHRRLPDAIPETPSLEAPPGGALPAVDPLVQQGRWGHLRVLERVGRGTFGQVYRAWDTRLDREVALKLLPAGPAASHGRASSIIEEGRLLARVRHPNVVSIYGAERIGEHVGLWMEFVDGRTLEQMLQQGHAFDQKEVVAIGIQLCRAVAAVHQAGLLHRDIKAHNVMLTNDNRVVLMDFGTGREFGDGPAESVAGTPLYLAPELLAGGDATVASDLYGVGVLLYHLLTGSYPVQARNIPDLRSAHERGERADLANARPDLTAKLVRIIQRAIDPQPAQRPQSTAALASELELLRPRTKVMPLAYAVMVTAALALVVWIATDSRSRPGQPGTPAAVAGIAAPSPAERPIIAVLPLKNLSSEPDSDYFVDGLTDELIRNLAVIDGLHVRSSTSSFSFKDKPRNLRDVGDQLGVNLVVEGSVLRSGNNLRVNAQLIQVAGDIPLWSDRFDRELKDVFAIQDDISRAIVNKLRLTLGRGQRRYDANVEAYELYLKGRALVDRKGVPSLEEAAALFEQVLGKDPTFAPAYAGLANAYALMSTPPNSSLPFETAHAILRPAAVKARELDPLLAEAHAAMGWVYSRERNWANAEKAFQRAIELNPSLTHTYTSYALSTLQPLGKHDESLRILREALRNDPLSLDVLRTIGGAEFFAGRYAEAIDTLRHVVAIEPGFPFVETTLARALMFAGRLPEGLPLLEKLDGRHLGRFKNPQGRRAPYLAHAYVMTGRRAEAEILAAEHSDSPSSQAIIFAALGDKDRTFDALERMAAVRPHHVGPILRNPEMAVLRGDPRLTALRARFGLPAQ